MALLEVRGLVKFFGRRKVVDGVSFDVNPGEVVGLLGPNGAGKTTSFRMTTGQLTPNDGEVLFDGNDVTTLPMYKRARLGMGYLSQEPSIFRRLSVEKNLLAILEVLPRSRSLGRRLTRAERHERTDEALKQFKLEHVRGNPAARASGGEKRRLEIARCLVCEPKLILLDEPFAAVDPKTTEEIRRNIRELAQTGIGILLTDHNVREVLKITDRSYLIKDGKVVTKGTPAQLIEDPIAIDGYLGRTFQEDALGRPLQVVPMHAHAPAPHAPVPQPQPVAGANAIGQLLAQEKIHRLVEMLKQADKLKETTAELLTYGQAAVPTLMEALERKDFDLRVRSFEVLKHILGGSPAFDPYAPDAERRKQLFALRDRFLKAA